MRSLVVITVRCPVDGPVAITALDVDEVVVRSGSDVRATIRCPHCGAVLHFTSDPEPGLLRWAIGAMRDGCDSEVEEDEEISSPCEQLTQPMEAYLEYFRRELVITDTLDQMLALMDLSELRERTVAVNVR